MLLTFWQTQRRQQERRQKQRRQKRRRNKTETNRHLEVVHHAGQPLLQRVHPDVGEVSDGRLRKDRGWQYWSHEQEDSSPLRNAFRQAGRTPNSATIHEIRIKTKRARYAAELAGSTVGKPATRFINKARTVQGVLGMHQDALQAETYIRTFLKHSTSTQAAFVAGRMVERQRRRREKARKKMPRLFRSLLKRGENAWKKD